VNDAVDRLIVEREAMDHGFEGGMLLSAFAHVFLIGTAIAAPYLAPKKPPIIVADAFAVPMPPGGGGPRNPDPPAPAKAAAPDPEPAAPEPAPKFIKPPSKTEPPKTKGLPLPDAKTTKKAKKEEPPVAPATEKTSAKSKASGGGAVGGTGTNPSTPGLEFGPPGPGVPTGTDWLGDWYLAGVQRKIWSIWTQQIKSDFNQPITVRFTIQADGSVDNVEVLQSSGASLLDLAAKRAVYSAAPFGPLPKSYATTSFTIQAVFKPS
jgi:TonB family protein